VSTLFSFTGITVFLIEAALTALVFLAIKICASSLELDLVVKRWQLIFALLVVSMFNTLVLLKIWIPPILVYAPLTMVAMAVAGYAIARKNKLHATVGGFSLFAAMLLSEAAAQTTLMVLDIEYGNVLTHILLLSILGSTFLVLSLLVVSRLLNIVKAANTTIEIRGTLPALVILAGNGIVAIWIYLLILNELIDTASGLLLVIALLAITATATMAYFTLDKQARAAQENIVYRQQSEFYEAYLQEREADYLSSKVLKHDQRQHLVYLLQALEESQVEKSISYLKDMLQDIPLAKIAKSNNLVIDSLLNYKHGRIERAGIELVTSIEVPQQVNVNDVDLCIILGNLLANAIEATEQVANVKRVIKLTIRYKEGNNLGIRIENPHENTLKRGGIGKFASTKVDPKMHGLGLYSVQRTIEKYNGMLRMDASEDRFVATVFVYGEES